MNETREMPLIQIIVKMTLNLNHYSDLEAFSREYIREPILNPFKSYTDMKKLYPIQFTDLRFNVNHIAPKKIQLFDEYRAAPNNARLFIILKHRQTKMTSDGHKITQV